MPDAPNLFLSYARAEAQFVRAVASELERRGLHVGLDANLQPGDGWDDAVRGFLESANLVIVFLSSAAIDSPWVNFEIGAAVGREKTVLPVFLTEKGRIGAPAVIADRTGIDARHLKPDEVAAQIAAAAKAA